MVHLFQQLSMALQRENVVSFQSTLTPASPMQSVIFSYLISVCLLGCLLGRQKNNNVCRLAGNGVIMCRAQFHLESSLAVNVSLDVVSNSSLFSRIKLRCMRAICAIMRSRRFAAISIFFLFSLSSLPSMLLLPRCRRLDCVVVDPSPSEFCSPPTSSSNFYITASTHTTINLNFKYTVRNWKWLIVC